MIWTLVDTPSVDETFVLIEQGRNEVTVSRSCRLGNPTWLTATYAWQGLLLLSALVLAVQSRNVKQEFNESQSLAFMVYSHTLFLVV